MDSLKWANKNQSAKSKKKKPKVQHALTSLLVGNKCCSGLSSGSMLVNSKGEKRTQHESSD